MTSHFDKRAAKLNQMPKSSLCVMYRNGIYAPDGSVVRYVGGLHPLEKWRKDEIVSAILQVEFPEKYGRE